MSSEFWVQLPLPAERTARDREHTLAEWVEPLRALGLTCVIVELKAHRRWSAVRRAVGWARARGLHCWVAIALDPRRPGDAVRRIETLARRTELDGIVLRHDGRLARWTPTQLATIVARIHRASRGVPLVDQFPTLPTVTRRVIEAIAHTCTARAPVLLPSPGHPLIDRCVRARVAHDQAWGVMDALLAPLQLGRPLRVTLEAECWPALDLIDALFAYPHLIARLQSPPNSGLLLALRVARSLRTRGYCRPSALLDFQLAQGLPLEPALNPATLSALGLI